ncbi:hypothetical protein [Kitasatospora sp. NPDC057223]|uniref:hypothetical protein n=1 Tax=Kitasatospora sp. NPDC057223 TaxID=3346055 RepID=UPI0036364370
MTAASAAVTVNVGKPEAGPVTVGSVQAPAAAPRATASPSPLLTLAPAPAPAPRPATTLHGSVAGDTHGGDLRYFFVPVPENAESFGSADGYQLSDPELVVAYGQKDIISVLDSYGFKESVERTYRTADGKADVLVRLTRFSSASNTTEFIGSGGYTKADESFDIGGVAGGRGFLFKPKQKAFTGEMIGVAGKGDVQIEVEIDVKGDLDKALLTDVMKRQVDRLSSGG